MWKLHTTIVDLEIFVTSKSENHANLLAYVVKTMLTLYHVSFERRVAFLLTHFAYGWIINTQLYINNCNFL